MRQGQVSSTRGVEGAENGQERLQGKLEKNSVKEVWDGMKNHWTEARSSHVIKTFERLILQHLRPLVSDSLDLLDSSEVLIPGLNWRDLPAAQGLLTPGRAGKHSHVLLRCVQHYPAPLLVEKLSAMQVDHDMVVWITDYLTSRPQYVRLQGSLSDAVMCNTGAPHGTVLSPFLLTIYNSDFSFNSGTCHLQKWSAASMRTGRSSTEVLVESFVRWSGWKPLPD